MRVLTLRMANFRGIRSAELSFTGHTLLIGGNNVGKSSVCEALDLVLGPDRLSRTPPVEEFDFYNSEYLEPDGVTSKPLMVEVLLIDLSPEVERQCASHIELWHLHENRLLGRGEAEAGIPPNVVRCLRLQTVGTYDPEEDEFEAATYFSHSPNSIDGALKRVDRKTKRLFGFLYLRTLRTGSRALSLERGSLLDIILKLQGVGAGLWEKSIKRLRTLEPPLDADASDLAPILESIEKRLAQYIAVDTERRATSLFVSQLTREHLRKTISFFLSMSRDQKPVPFHEVGTGTLNILVLALLSFIAEAKKENIIFAMEEPEIALPPHTQRRVANYLLGNTTQCFVTSHSPYVIERFDPAQILILRRTNDAMLSSVPISVTTTLGEKMYRRFARRGLTEAMLGPGVIVVEGISEQSALTSAAAKMEQADDECYPLDLSGITILPLDGDGSLPKMGEFLKALGIKTYAFYDKKKRSPQEEARFALAFDLPCQTNYLGIETLLAQEVPLSRQWEFLDHLRTTNDGFELPTERPPDVEIPQHLIRCLRSKGHGFPGQLLELCDTAELPVTIRTFLLSIYQAFPKPQPVPLPEKAPASAPLPPDAEGGAGTAPAP